MKVCIPTMGGAGMDEAVAQHFGRAATFTCVDLDTGLVQVLQNQSQHMGGVGLPPDMISQHSVKAVIAGGLGPKAVMAFAREGIEVFVGAAGTVRNAVEDWKAGLLDRAGPDNACREHKH